MTSNIKKSSPSPTHAVSDEQKKEAEATQSSAFQFSISSFNIWCPHWNSMEETKKWKRRHGDITKILLRDIDSCSSGTTKKTKTKQTDGDEHKENGNDLQLPALDCDIFCFQEFWCDRADFVRLYETYFKGRGFDLHSLKRNASHKPDGLAMAFNTNVFEMVRKTDYKFTVSNRVMMMMELRHKASRCVLTVASTHLTFPQHSYDDALRAKQINECLQVLNERTSTQSSLMVLAGDFNCGIAGNESKQCLNDGYLSSYHVCNADDNKHVVSHINHEKQSVFVDHIFYKQNPNADKVHIFAASPVESYLYPKSLQSESWNQQWQLSDHRPIVTAFKLTRDSSSL